jgi:ribosomal protein L37AE/L43A
MISYYDSRCPKCKDDRIVKAGDNRYVCYNCNWGFSSPPVGGRTVDSNERVVEAKKKPCPDCAHTTSPGFYVGIFKTEKCTMCQGSAEVYE